MKGPLAKSTLRTGLVLGARLFVQTSTLLLVARILGTQQFGAFAALAAIAVLLGSLSTFGMQVVLLRNVSRSAKSELATLQVALPVTLLCSVLLLLAFLITTALQWEHHQIPLATLGMIGAAEIILMPLLALRAAGQHGLGKVAASQLTMLLPLTLRLLAALAVMMANPENPLSAYAVGYLIAAAFALALSLLAPLPRWPGISLWRLPDRQTIAIAGGYAVLNLNRIGPTELDKALAGTLLPLDTAGIYSAASRLIGATTLPVTAMNLSALPRLFREHDNKPQKARKLLLIMYATAFCYGTAIAACAWIAAPLFPHIFGTGFQNIERMVQLLSFVIPGMALRLVGGNVIMALGRPWVRASLEGLGMTALALGALYLTSRLGDIGLITALAISEWGMAILCALFIRHSVTQSAPASKGRTVSSDSPGHNHQFAPKAPKANPPT